MGGRRYSCREGQAFMVLSDMDYSYGLPASSSSWELLYINLSGLPVLQYARAVLDQHGPIYDISEPHHRHMHSLLVEIFAKARGGKGLSEQTESRLAWSLLMEVFDSSIMNQQSSGSWLTLIQDHVKGNLQSDISVAELASLSGYSEFHFSRKFKAATGISPSQFVRNTRMQLAQQMLKQERYSIQEVCQATGFKDQSHFGKCFKQSFGCSPKRFQMEYL
jgi:AraC-like DNA-binding protein